MESIIKPFLKGEIDVREGSWHHRLYQYWRSKGGWIPYSYHENLCHYVRVCIFWAPFAWFLYAKLKGVFFLRPWVISLITLLLATIAVTAVIWPSASWKVNSTILIAIGAIIGVVAIATAFLLIFSGIKKRIGRKIEDWWHCHEVGIEKWIDRLKNITIVLILIVVVCLFIFLLVLGFWKIPLTIGIVIGVILGIVLAAVTLLLIIALLVGYLIEPAWKRLRHRYATAPTIRMPIVISKVATKTIEETRDGVSLAGHYIRAKKHRICPLINFVDEQ